MNLRQHKRRDYMIHVGWLVHVGKFWFTAWEADDLVFTSENYETRREARFALLCYRLFGDQPALLLV